MSNDSFESLEEKAIKELANNMSNPALYGVNVTQSMWEKIMKQYMFDNPIENKYILYEANNLETIKQSLLIAMDGNGDVLNLMSYGKFSELVDKMKIRKSELGLDNIPSSINEYDLYFVYSELLQGVYCYDDKFVNVIDEPVIIDNDICKVINKIRKTVSNKSHPGGYILVKNDNTPQINPDEWERLYSGPLPLMTGKSYSYNNHDAVLHIRYLNCDIPEIF